MRRAHSSEERPIAASQFTITHVRSVTACRRRQRSCHYSDAFAIFEESSRSNTSCGRIGFDEVYHRSIGISFYNASGGYFAALTVMASSIFDRHIEVDGNVHLMINHHFFAAQPPRRYLYEVITRRNTLHYRSPCYWPAPTPEISVAAPASKISIL